MPRISAARTMLPLVLDLRPQAPLGRFREICPGTNGGRAVSDPRKIWSRRSAWPGHDLAAYVVVL